MSYATLVVRSLLDATEDSLSHFCLSHTVTVDVDVESKKTVGH
jgi:hypothetical protein